MRPVLLAAVGVWALAASGAASPARPQTSFAVWAHELDTGNVRVSLVGQAYADKHPCIWNAGRLPNQAEYEIEFPVTADYRFVALYAAHSSRPVDIYLDGKKVHRGFAGLTGSWRTSSARWARRCTLRITKGVHTIKLLCRGACMPHICAFRLESSVAFPKGWKPRRPRLAQRRAREARARRLAGVRPRLERLNVEALRLAVRDLMKTFPRRYPNGRQYLARIDALARRLPAVRKALQAGEEDAIGQVEEILAFQREVLLANPLLAFGKLLLVKRGVRSPALGLPQNWQSNCVLPRGGFDDEIAVLCPPAPDGKLTTLYKPPTPVFVGDVDLHFDAGRLLFSSIGAHGRWQIFEIGADGRGLRQVTPGRYNDVDNYDACYLPDGRIVFGSTRAFVSVPCVNGSTRVSNLFVMDSGGRRVRQLCFDQEHNWCPTVLGDGRVMYLRWQYTDTPHTHDRILFSMNPDGTEQRALYGRNSYWPNSLFYARPIPGNPTKFVGIVGGHHGVPRMGELVLFDVARGREEAAGAVQRIPGRGQTVRAKIQDKLVRRVLAEVPPPLAAGRGRRPSRRREVFPGGLQAGSRSAVGHLPGGRVRQPDADPGAARLRAAGADPAATQTPPGDHQKLVRGGSWRDRPKRCRSAFRLAYRPYQRVYNVGFRVVCRAEDEVAVRAAAS